MADTYTPFILETAHTQTRCSEMSHTATPHSEGRHKLRPTPGKPVFIHGKKMGSFMEEIETGDWGKLARAGEPHVVWADTC